VHNLTSSLEGGLVFLSSYLSKHSKPCGTCWEQLRNILGTNGNILETSEEHVGTLGEHSNNDGNFYEIKILESINPYQAGLQDENTRC
jgi:hypothetical protein